MQGSTWMPRNRLGGLIGLVGWLAAGTCAAAAPVACPRTISRGETYVLSDAALFDGLPDNTTDLPPVKHGKIWEWDLTGTKIDPYLKCIYGGNEDMDAQLHAPGATLCTLSEQPFSAQCLTGPPGSGR